MNVKGDQSLCEAGMSMKNVQHTPIDTYLRKYVADEAEYIASWTPGKGERELSAAVLQSGEVSAVVFRVGCYEVRSAQRVDGVHDISARHSANPDSPFIHVCMACSKRQGGIEYIGDIFAVKSNAGIPDECAFLLVYKHYESPTSGIDTWYRLDPDGKVIEIKDGV